jgi:hypothetical protein
MRMTVLTWQTFVLQRRIGAPPEKVLRTIGNSAVFGAGTVLSSDDDGVLRLDEPFRRADAYSEPVWRAHARLLGARRRVIARVEIEISPWSAIDTQLLIRPRARNPERWSGRRLRRYFFQAHRSADELTHLLVDAAPAGNARAASSVALK